MLLIIGMNSISVTCYDSIYVIFKLLPTCNIYRIILTVHLGGQRQPKLQEDEFKWDVIWEED